MAQYVTGPAYSAYNLPSSQIPPPASTSGQALPGFALDSIQLCSPNTASGTSHSNMGLILGLAVLIPALAGLAWVIWHFMSKKPETAAPAKNEAPEPQRPIAPHNETPAPNGTSTNTARRSSSIQPSVSPASSALSDPSHSKHGIAPNSPLPAAKEKKGKSVVTESDADLNDYVDISCPDLGYLSWSEIQDFKKRLDLEDQAFSIRMTKRANDIKKIEEEFDQKWDKIEEALRAISKGVKRSDPTDQHAKAYRSLLEDAHRHIDETKEHMEETAAAFDREAAFERALRSGINDLRSKHQLECWKQLRALWDAPNRPQEEKRDEFIRLLSPLYSGSEEILKGHAKRAFPSRTEKFYKPRHSGGPRDDSDMRNNVNDYHYTLLGRTIHMQGKLDCFAEPIHKPGGYIPHKEKYLALIKSTSHGVK